MVECSDVRNKYSSLGNILFFAKSTVFDWLLQKINQQRVCF